MSSAPQLAPKVLVAAAAGEAAAGRPAPQEVAELLLNEVGQALAVAEIGRLRPKRLEVIAHHLMQNACCRGS